MTHKDQPSIDLQDINDNEANEDLVQAITSLLEESMVELRKCSLAIASDQYFYPAMDSLLRRTSSQKESTAGMFFSIPFTLYFIPNSLKEAKDYLPSDISDHYSNIGKETCANYIFLLKESRFLLSLLETLYQDNLDLKAKFIFFTDVDYDDIATFLKSSPVSKIVNVLLAIPNMDSGKSVLSLHTHAFFLNNQRISVKTLGIWRSGQTSLLFSNSPVTWFPEKLQNFHGFKFRATTFNHPPVSIFEPKDNGGFSYDGLEIRLLMTIASSLNFTVEISKPKDGQKWGSKLDDGSWTGAMGETVRGEADVSFANYFITSARLKIIDMTRPYYIDYTCFITPMPQPLPQYTAVAWPFQLDVWIAVFLMLILVPPVIRLAGTLEVGSWFKNFHNTFLYVLGIFLTRSQPMQLVPLSSGLRVIVIASWIAAMVMAVAYKSSLIAFLLVPLPAQPVNTLEDLLESGLHWGVRDTGGWGQWFSNSIDPTSRKIAEGFEFVRGIDGGLARVQEGDFAFMNSGTFLRYLVSSNFTDEYGQTELHVTKECFVPFRIGLGMPRFSVYTSKFNAVVARVVEGGMVTRWFQDLLAKAEKKQREKVQEKRWLSQGFQDPSLSARKHLSLYHVQGPFFLLFAGWVIATCGFLIEMLIYHSFCPKDSYRPTLSSKDDDKALSPIGSLVTA